MDTQTCEVEVQLAHLTLCSLEMIHGRSQTIQQILRYSFLILLSYNRLYFILISLDVIY